MQDIVQMRGRQSVGWRAPEELTRQIAREKIQNDRKETASVLRGCRYDPAFSQVDIKTYTDGDGYLDVQKLTCGQLANTFQEDAYYLAA